MIQPECYQRMSEKWIPELTQKIIRMGRREKTGDILVNIDSLSAGIYIELV